MGGTLSGAQMQSQFQTGLAFYYGAVAIKDAREAIAEVRGIPVGYPDIAAGVNLAFSIELMLKALLNCAQTPMRGHKLSDLFGGLSEPLQRDVIYQTCAHGPFDAAEAKTLLTTNSEAFEEWRYHFEKSGLALHGRFLAAFASGIVDVATRTYPDLLGSP